MNTNEPFLVHKNENLLYGLCVITSIFIILYLLLSIIGAFILIFFALISYFSHIISMSHIQLNGVRLRKTQFPDLYHKVNELSEKMELNKIPEVYIIESGGLINAFATKVFGVFGKNMVVLYSDFVEISLDSSGNEIDFVIAHELAHIKRNHIVKSILVFPAMWFPLVGFSYLRMAEYTCDRMAAYYTGQPASAIDGLLILAAGRRLYKRVNLEDYLNQYNEKKGLFATLTELLSTHPPLPKRIHEIEHFMFKKTTVQLINRTKQVVAIAFILFFMLPAISVGLIFAGVKAVENFDFIDSFLSEYTPLMEATSEGNLDEVEALLIEGADPNVLNEYGESALLIATYNERVDIMELLLAYGADPNIQDEYGWTPLMSAVMVENLEVGKVLLVAGADPSLVDDYDHMSAIDLAKEIKNHEFVELLKAYQ